MDTPDNKQLAIKLLNFHSQLYTYPLYNYIVKNPHLQSSFPALLLRFEKVVVYLGRTHVGIEYYGPERIEKLEGLGFQVELSVYDYCEQNNFFEKIIGFEYDGTSKIEIPLPLISDDLMLPTNKGVDKLIELGWNFGAQNMLFSLNTGNMYIQPGKFTRIVNGFFFDCQNDSLITRHVKWLDLFPVTNYQDLSEAKAEFTVDFSPALQLIQRDAHSIYPLPNQNDFKYSKLYLVNRFIELIGNNDSSETAITTFLAKEAHKFILTMAFFAKEVHAEKLCEWQSETRQAIKPDFFVVKPDGYADIVEFKLPKLKSKILVGKNNRETLSAELNSYISQTRAYKYYFQDPNNRAYLETKHKVKVFDPKRILVVGRRFDYDSTAWREVTSEYADLTILSYDSLIDGIISQFYQ